MGEHGEESKISPLPTVMVVIQVKPRSLTGVAPCESIWRFVLKAWAWNFWLLLFGSWAFPPRIIHLHLSFDHHILHQVPFKRQGTIRSRFLGFITLSGICNVSICASRFKYIRFYIDNICRFILRARNNCRPFNVQHLPRWRSDVTFIPGSRPFCLSSSDNSSQSSRGGRIICP